MESDESWACIRQICNDYDMAKTHYRLKEEKEWKAYERAVREDASRSKPSRPEMKIAWLRPIWNLTKVDYNELCKWASTPIRNKKTSIFYRCEYKPLGERDSGTFDSVCKIQIRNYKCITVFEIKVNMTEFNWQISNIYLSMNMLTRPQ